MANADSIAPPESLVFRYGADMAPEAIIAETPRARFVARARLSPAAPDHSPATPGNGIGAQDGADAVWGILLIQPEPPAACGDADVVTDTGRVTHVAVLTDAAALADPAAVARQARYWELSPSYIADLETRRGVPSAVFPGG